MEKMIYVAKMLNRRTVRKNYENFVVNAIYAKLNNPHLIPVTQQYVRSKVSRKYCLLDLYFPQLNYGIEVDESYHHTREQQLSDKERAEYVKSVIECNEGRIAIYKDAHTPHSYTHIKSQIDAEVAKINKMIAEKESREGKLIWKDNDDLKAEVIQRGTFHVNDQVDYKGITEIYNITGHPAQQIGRCFIRLNEHYFLWVPPLSIRLDDGSIRLVDKWVNTLNEDRTEITEVDEKGNRYDIPEGPSREQFQRIVFMKMRDRFGLPCVRFVGVFKAFDMHYEQTFCVRRYRRVATEIKIADLNRFH